MKKGIWLFLMMLFIGALIIALGVGRYAISLYDVGRIIFDTWGITGWMPPPTQEMQLVFWNIRLPRIVMSFVVGAGVSVAGVVSQGIFRNPLAAPDILGVTHGAGFGAALAIMFFTNIVIGIQGCAFIFGILAVSAAYFFASRSSDQSAAVLVIAGIVVSAIFQAGLTILMYMAEPYDQLAKIVFWTLGSFQAASWIKVQTAVPVVTACVMLLAVFGWRLNIMTLIEEEALSLGINIFRWRAFYLALSILIMAASVSAVGSVKWFDLIIPHIARYLVGTEHKRLIMVSALLGGSFMMLMDSLARSVFAMEIPVSIITSIFGAPFLGYLILSRKGGAMGSDRAS